MIRVDRDPAKCNPLVTNPKPKGPTVTEQVDAFRAQLEAGIDRDAVANLSDEDAAKVADILKRAGL